MKQLAMVLSLLVSVAITAPLAFEAQKGKPRPQASYPGTTSFGCDLAGIDLCDDGIVGDGTNYPGVGANETGSGAHLTGSAGELWLGSSASGHMLTLDFRGQTGTCGAACRWDWVNHQRYTLSDFEIQSNAVTGPSGAEITGGLLGIPEGGRAYARLKINFSGPGGFLYELRFNALDAPGSTALDVTRTAACSWSFTDAGALAHFKSGSRRTLVDEGLFVMPVTFTFTVPGCVTGS